MAGIFQHGAWHNPSASPKIAFSDRTVEHACLAETAAADTASLDLQHHAVLGGLQIRERQGLLRIIGVRHIHDDLLFRLTAGHIGTYGVQRTRWCHPPYKSPHKGRERKSPEFLPRRGEILLWSRLFALYSL